MQLMFDSNLKQHQEDIKDILLVLHDITKKIGHEELEHTVGDLCDRVDDPYMFVIVGEVKAGKSSFINALLDTEKEICKVAPSPMTDTIQQIVYGEQESYTSISEYLKRITFPLDILKEVAIVDTPGTNTIVDYHQEITEGFIPSSDLIVFVFESKNPYRESAWKFLEFIKEEWRKKIIFVLQQKDLMPDNDLQINIDGVRQQAIKKGITQPTIFAVSAKQELEGLKEESGFVDIRNYITENITGGKAPYLKLLNNAENSLTINDKIYQGLDLRKLQYEKDIEFRGDIKTILDRQDQKTKKQIEILVENLLAKYDAIAKKYESELDEGFAFTKMLRRSFKSIFGNEKGVKQWLDELFKNLESELNTKLREKLQDGVIDIADNIQDMAKLVDAKIKTSETVLKDNHEIYADIAEKRANVLKDLQRAFHDFMKKSENFYADGMGSDGDKIIPNIAAGGGAAVIGLILTAVTNGAILDVTGGILTAVGLVFAGVSVGMNKRKVMNQYSSEIMAGRLKIEEEVTEKLVDYTENIKQKIDSNFFAFDQLLAEEQEMINYLEEKHIEVKSGITAIKEKVNTLL